MQTGVAAFIAGLGEFGYEPVQLPGRPDHVVIDYEVESGKFVGTKLNLGFIVPADFPFTPPGGIHVSEPIHPLQAGGQHPTGGIHREHATPFREALGGDWQYWSRPPADWATGKKTVAAYMSHVWRVWDSQ
ncbi:MAG TPA: hypothetical protein DEV93_06820 [Chloroflexi bacterium]|jgi:hypothetical protein|nr:hypothetical protein [Chloroflexota bacterium]